MARQQFPKRNADDAAQVARGGIRDRGAELPDRVQAAFDGHDLSGVRVHRNADAARRLRADAYTVGDDIVVSDYQHHPAIRAAVAV